MEAVKAEKPGKCWLLLLFLCAAAALVYRFAHFPLLEQLLRARPLPAGLGLAISQWVLVAAGLTAAKTEGTLRLKGPGLCLLLLALVLGACYGIYANAEMRLFNLPVLAALTAQGCYALTGKIAASPFSCDGWREGFLRFWPGLIDDFPVPFRAYRAWKNEKGRRLRGVVRGLLLGVPAVLAAILLLASADGVFGSLFARALDGIHLHFFTRLPANLWRLVTAALLAMLLFSGLYSLTRPPRPIAPPKKREIPAPAFLIPLGCLAALYALFAYIQVRYLFLGMEAAAMEGGYAAYARSGFFQLTAVASLSLAIVLPALTQCGESGAVRLFGAAVTLLTGVILASAAYRMGLYILSYGLSLLRLLTVWALFMLLIALVLALFKCACPQVRVCPLLTAALLTGWVGLNYLNVDARIAEYNVRAYNEGQLARLDTRYLIEDLSPDAAPALLAIEVMPEAEKRAVWAEAVRTWDTRGIGFYECSLHDGKTELLRQALTEEQ